jgi:hypothetical protein
MARVDDLQRWLALEHEAVWLYGVIGARVRGLRNQAGVSYDAHRAVRDRLLQAIADRGGRPVGTALTYGNERIDTRRVARHAASDVETRIAAACLTAFGPADTSGRRLAMAGLRRSALAALDWGADPRAFPGLA